ncbi:MAG: undecaprenyldiphospho-muramoylpentapeptide beta-N-acetylglucosaminyltransferase [bacterium]|nr:undecaprenyldiphospho-muramoylpentapeptide beta-N-acetylglucosaminyltransferase [bacterium]
MTQPLNPDTGTEAREPHALLSGGGSGGHVFPGLAIAEELGRRGWRVSWAGSGRGIEARLVSERSIPFHALPARPLVGQGLYGKARAAATLARSAWSARSLIRRLCARVVVGTGGYASAPAVVGAALAARPVLLLEPNAEAGFANRWLSRLASEAAVAFDETAQQLKCPSSATGIPVRSEFFTVAEDLPASPPWRLLVLGGSQGARQINELVPRALGLLADRDITVCHQTGEKHLESTTEAYRAAGLAEVIAPSAACRFETECRFETVAFLDDVSAAMARSHLIVSRAGAITLAEICAAGRPSLLVPLALAGDHQAANARGLAKAGATEILPREAGEADLAEILGRLLTADSPLAAMARNARELGRPDAAEAIADRVEFLGEEAS